MEEAKLGGILGWENGSREGVSILECYNTGNISGDRFAGGIVGNIGVGIIENCYNTGIIESDDKSCMSGGISGQSNMGVIKNCYNAGSLIGKNSCKSAIAKVRSGTFEFRNYYISNCGTDYASYSDPTDEMSICVTEEELKNLAPSLGEYFTKDVENINNGYPILKWQVNN